MGSDTSDNFLCWMLLGRERRKFYLFREIAKLMSSISSCLQLFFPVLSISFLFSPFLSYFIRPDPHFFPFLPIPFLFYMTRPHFHYDLDTLATADASKLRVQPTLDPRLLVCEFLFSIGVILD